MEFSKIPSPNPIEHAKNIEDILCSLKCLCKSEVHVFDQHPKAKALLETSAEVLGGLEKAFHDFLAKEMDAWKDEEELTAQRSSDPWD
ncbi:MAG: hypothetical protein ACLGHN_05555 [Bacteriovoracia bacterium]